MSITNRAVIAQRLTTERLRSYLVATSGDLDAALDLYEWNTLIGGAIHEDIGRFEVVFRNAVDIALQSYADQRGWTTPWYHRHSLFSERATADIKKARERATKKGRKRVPEVHGKVVAELTFGFWRFLCTTPYLTSLWVPALAAAFPNHPSGPADPRQIRHDVDQRVDRIQFLRNRVAHHEPIHHRDIERDRQSMLEVLSWVCSDTSQWAASSSRMDLVLQIRPKWGA